MDQAGTGSISILQFRIISECSFMKLAIYFQTLLVKSGRAEYLLFCLLWIAQSDYFMFLFASVGTDDYLFAMGQHSIGVECYGTLLLFYEKVVFSSIFFLAGLVVFAGSPHYFS